MTLSFDVLFDRLLGNENGYVNNLRDPGGETNFGLSKRTYPQLDIRHLTRDQAKVIYRRDFYNPLVRGLPNLMQFQLFDAGVNHGIPNAIRLLQRAVGVAEDGHWGPVSSSALENKDKNDVLLLFLAERLDFMRKLSTFDQFGRGWSGRIATNLRYGAQDN